MTQQQEREDVVRDVVDVGVRIRLAIPPGWREAPVEGTVLVVGGPLEDRPHTLVPSVQIGIRRAESAEAVRQAVGGVVRELDEPEIAFEGAGTGPSGHPEAVLEVAHRNKLTRATQVSMFRSILLPDDGRAVSVVATIGGGASREARDALRTIVRSVAVGPLPPGVTAD
ncbi:MULTISPECIES: hypothetical protein [unclassified Blastococcus]